MRDERPAPVEENRKKRKPKIKQPKLETASVMFIPRTPGGILAEELRKNEETISNQSGHKIKLV